MLQWTVQCLSRSSRVTPPPHPPTPYSCCIYRDREHWCRRVCPSKRRAALASFTHNKSLKNELMSFFSLPSRSSVDYVAPTPDNFSHTPLIVPSSPTELEDENGRSALLSQFGFRHGISWWIKLTSLCVVRCWFTNGYVTASGWQGSRRKGRANGNRGRPQATTICIYSHIPKFPWFCFRTNSLCTVPARVLSCMSFTLYFQQPI